MHGRDGNMQVIDLGAPNGRVDWLKYQLYRLPYVEWGFNFSEESLMLTYSFST